MRRTRALPLALLGVLLGAGCAGADADAPAGLGDGEPPLLTATVGEPDDPDAYTMTLTDAAGEPVRTLPAGTYRVVVTDHSAIHNLHLRGPAVEESTSVVGTGQVTWTVRLEPGPHTYVCDPHPGMTEEFVVV